MTKVQPTGIGIIGCGVISEIYLKNLTSWPDVKVVAVADMLMERAEQRAKQFGVAASTVEDLLVNPAIDLVLNLTIPAAHAEIGVATLNAGKAFYTEKPLATKRADGKQLIDLAAAGNLRIGGAPDTFLGGSLQTCRKLLDEGIIGEPVAATAFFASHGPETWHPQPEFFYLPGGGPMYDMGPYYITALVTLLGGVRRVAGSARASFSERVVGPLDKPGRTIPVETPTHIASVLDFASGPIATLVTSFDVWAHDVPRIEIYGTKGTLSVPDPNNFGDPVKVRLAGESAWRDCPIEFGFTQNSRGIGLRDLARAMRDGGPHRADGALTYHVLDVMTAVFESSAEDRHINLECTYERPAPLTPFDGE